MIKGLVLAAIQLAIVLSLTGKYAWDRGHLPRAWARTMNYDPNLPIRGRYVSLRPFVNVDGAPTSSWGAQGRLFIRDGQLAATVVPGGDVQLWGISRRRVGVIVDDSVESVKDWTLGNPIAFFIPEGAHDPTDLKTGEELWVELSVPPSGEPRPLRLAVKKPDGTFTALELR